MKGFAQIFWFIYGFIQLVWSDGSVSDSRHALADDSSVRLKRSRHLRPRDFSMWIDEEQVKAFSGYLMPIYVFSSGRVMPYILDPNFEQDLPVIPNEVNQVNLTWTAGRKKYFYEFFNLRSENASIVKTPTVSIKRKGRIPKKIKKFSIGIECVPDTSGVTSFSLGFKVWHKDGDPLENTPLTLTLRKNCLVLENRDVHCNEKCGENGFCDREKRCLCKDGYMGPRCQEPLCYPKCKNGGICSAPGICKCHSGYQGRYCEGGICLQKCLNGGKCVQKDRCSCRKGFYGHRCEFSKCVIPCINGGKCRGVNKCKCLRWYSGDHCQIMKSKKLSRKLAKCDRRCFHGNCSPHAKCNCIAGYSGKWCRRKKKNRKKARLHKSKILV